MCVADGLRRLQRFRHFFRRRRSDVAGRRDQTILVEDRADVLRRVIEVAGNSTSLYGGGDFREVPSKSVFMESRTV